MILRFFVPYLESTLKLQHEYHLSVVQFVIEKMIAKGFDIISVVAAFFIYEDVPLLFQSLLIFGISHGVQVIVV